MHDRFTSNPFSKKAPLQNYGTLRVSADGENWYDRDDGVQLPYIGPVFDYKEDDPEHMRPQLRHKACVAQWNLDDEEHMKQYRALCEKICRKQAIVSFEERIYDDEIKSWRILIRWMEPFYGPPAAALRHLKETANANGGRLPKKSEAKPMHDEDLPEQPEDWAKVEAEQKKAEENSDDVESNNEIPSRYGTFDEVISAFGDSFPELGKPSEPEDSGE